MEETAEPNPDRDIVRARNVHDVSTDGVELLKTGVLSSGGHFLRQLRHTERCLRSHKGTTLPWISEFCPSASIAVTNADQDIEFTVHSEPASQGDA